MKNVSQSSEFSVAIETRPCDPSQISRDQVTQSTQTDKDIAVANRNAPIDNKVQNIKSSPSLAHNCAILSDEMNPGDASSTSANAPPPTLVEKSDVRTRKYNMLCRFFERGFCRLKKKCRFLHICLNFRSKCCNKNDCSFDHVDLCSVLTCSNRECVFAHVTPDFRKTRGLFRKTSSPSLNTPTLVSAFSFPPPPIHTFPPPFPTMHCNKYCSFAHAPKVDDVNSPPWGPVRVSLSKDKNCKSHSSPFRRPFLVHRTQAKISHQSSSGTAQKLTNPSRS